MSSQSPEEIRAEIERTRAALSDDVDALAEDARPKNIAKRQVDKVKDKGVGLKDRIMGSVSDAQDAVSDKAHDVAGRCRTSARRSRQRLGHRTRCGR